MTPANRRLISKRDLTNQQEFGMQIYRVRIYDRVMRGYNACLEDVGV